MSTQQWQLNQSQLRTLVVLAAAAVGFYFCFALARPFLSPLTMGLVLGLLLLPLHRRIERSLPWPSAAAFVSVAVAGVVIIVPGLFVAHQLGREAAIGAGYLEHLLRDTEWRDAAAGYPRIAEVVVWIEQRLNPAGMLADLASWLTSRSTLLLRGSVTQLINGILTFYLLFYVLRDRHQARRLLASISPLSDAETDELIQRFTDTVHATVFGTVVVAGVQGALGGLMFWWLGLPSPMLWALVMALLAVVPVLGTFVVWVPAAIFLALSGAWVKAVILVAWGGGLVATIDNLLYPILVGNRLRLHPVPTFIGMIGGMFLFGTSGLVLGPAIIAVTQALLNILRRRFESAPLR
ncbi:MAG TPA: AI-2E family transporter [Acetobacteraceae bacterium]|nr:AI-2E family transporter [Acetobacteraceae bacterium]